MSRKQMLPLIIVVTLVILFLIGCGGQLSKEPSPQERIIGVWQDPNRTSASIQFKGDGTVESSSDNGSFVQMGTYKFVEALVIESPDGHKSIRIVSISENELTLEAIENGNVITLRRVGAIGAPAKAPQEPVGPPQGAKDAAINYIKATACQYRECKDFKIGGTSAQQVSSADQANNIEEKWCLEVMYISYNPAVEKWEDVRFSIEAQKTQGSWQTGLMCFIPK